MKRFAFILASAAMALMPSAALARSATLQLVLHIPVQCEIDVMSGTVADGQVTLLVKRQCNTGHDIVLTGNNDGDLAGLRVEYNGGSVPLSGGQAVMAQPEAFYDQVDTIVLHSDGGDEADLLAFASSMRLSVVTA